jgi:peptidyl-prolyl cis-trans isomerase C
MGSQAEEKSVLVKKGNAIITHEQFDARIQKIPEHDRLDFVRDGAKVDRMLNNLILIQQLAEEARSAQIHESKSVGLQMQLAADKALADAWLEYYVESSPDADYEQLAKEFYLLNAESFMSEERRDISHILIKTDDRTESEAYQLITKLRELVVQDPIQFDSLIPEYSEDPSVNSNLGHFLGVKRGMMEIPFENVAFSMSNGGEISDIVATKFGYHIIRLDQVHPAHPISFEEVKEKLIVDQKKIHRERVKNEYLRGLTGVPLEIPDEAIESMLRRYFGENLENAPDYSTVLDSEN